MTHLEIISGPDPKYTEKALEREVEGTTEVRCIVGIDGRVRDCRVLKSLPFIDRRAGEAPLQAGDARGPPGRGVLPVQDPV